MSHRGDFEKLPHILCLMQYVTCFDGLKYVSDNQYLADYLNGAWDTYQVQQAEVDKRLSDYQLEVSQVGQACVQWKELVDGKQAEINVLKAKIDDLTKWAESHIKDYNSSVSNSEHDRGWFNAACQVLKKLKGGQK